MILRAKIVLCLLLWAGFSQAACSDSLFNELKKLPIEQQAYHLVHEISHSPWTCNDQHRLHLANFVLELAPNPLHEALYAAFLGGDFIQSGNIDSALVLLHQSTERLNDLEGVHPLVQSYVLSEYAFALYTYGAYKQHVKVLIQAISVLEGTAYTDIYLQLKSNLSVFYRMRGQYDEVLKQMDEMLLLDSIPATVFADLYANKSKAYLGIEEFEKSIDFANLSIDHAKQNGQNYIWLDAELFKLEALAMLSRKEEYNATLQVVNTLMDAAGNKIPIHSYQCQFARALTASKQPKEAIAYLKNLELESLSVKNRTEVYSLLSKNHEQLNNSAAALDYYKKGKQLKDSLANISVRNEVNVLHLNYRTAEREHKLLNLKKEQDSQQARFLFWSIFGLSSLLLVLASLVILMLKIRVNRLRHEQEKRALQLQLEQQQLEESQLQHEMEHKEQLVLLEAMKLSEKNALLASTAERLGVITEKGNNAKGELRELKKSLESAIMSEHSWKEFNHIFKDLNPSFIRSIEIQHESLTQREMRLLCLVKLKLNIAECATLLHIEPKSVKMARYRLKRKLHLAENESLELYVSKLSANSSVHFQHQ